MSHLFEEKQKFTQWWVWSLLLLPIIITASFSFPPNSGPGVIIALAIPLLFYFFELRVRVNEQGLNYQFFPIHFRSYRIKKSDIEKIEALKYKPLGDYGGWGIRYGFKGKCYNVKGDLGVKVFLKNGSYILFGSQRHKELEKSLQKIIEQ
ncbi:MAG: hypothetical protein CMD19_05805 [Flavobacteriales bacterium]|nr:hypothetical protein [Flavobacteriales bacterium]|tara:strand:+ start:934 stop:1383 length:450 start_codon:yes stop_codon:yes gene_type:complete